MTTPIPLLHVWDNQKLSQAKGLFAIGDGVTIPKGWEPAPANYKPQALPTPFARAEATRLVLARVEEAGDHELLMQFKWLVLGIAAGVLHVEPLDLASDAFDNLGRALRQVDADARYFGRITWPKRELMYGATYRTSLVWGHARRTQDDWDQLAREVQPLQGQAQALLADFRAALEQAGRWSRDRVAWQRGIDHLIGATQPSPGLATLHKHARFVGPAMVSLPFADPEVATALEPVYLPAYAPDFADSFVKLCNFKPVAGATAIEFRDAQDKSVGAIAMPAGGAEVDAIALGMGVVGKGDDGATKVPLAQQKLWVQGKDGLVEQLKPLQLALDRWERPLAEASRALPLYPDAVRILIGRGYWPGISASSGSNKLTGRAELRLSASGAQLPTADEAEANGGASAAYEASAGTAARLVFLDVHQGVDVLDLRALGYVLFRVFVREATVADNGPLEDAESFEPLTLHAPEHPLEPHARIYESVALPPPEPLRSRLATLQRFASAYASGGSGMARVLDRAARSFCAWAAGEAVIPLGRKAAEHLVYRLPAGTELRLWIDPLNRANA